VAKFSQPQHRELQRVFRYFKQMTLQRLDQIHRQHCDPVSAAFCIANADLCIGEINFFYSQPHAFHYAQAAAVKQRCHQFRSVRNYFASEVANKILQLLPHIPYKTDEEALRAGDSRRKADRHD
jgi:hypothetical protein